MATPSAIPNVLRLHHVGVVVRDAEAAAEDYRRGLELEVLFLRFLVDVKVEIQDYISTTSRI